MDSAFELPILITYRPPLWMAITLVISHVGAIICIFTVPVPPWIRFLIVTAVISSFLWTLSRYLSYRYRTEPVRLILNSSDDWTLADERGDRPISLFPGAFVHPRLLVLRFRDNRRSCSFILTRSNMDADMLRRLRVRLRFSNNNEE